MQSLTSINRGICQGIITNDIYYPSDNVAIVTLKVRDDRINPKTGEKAKYFIQFTAFDEQNEIIRANAQNGQILYVEYQLTTSKKMDDYGVSKFYRNRVIQNLAFGDVLLPDVMVNVPYQNLGFAQGEFVNLRRVKKFNDIAFLTVRIHMNTDDGRERIFYPQFTVFGGMIDLIESKFQEDDTIHVTYKVETRMKTDDDGKKLFFTDYIANKIM